MRERENKLLDIIFMFLGFTAAIGAHSISEDIGFFPLWFPRGKFFVFLVSCDYCGNVILSDKILKSYCLNDKNLTWYQS